MSEQKPEWLRVSSRGWQSIDEIGKLLGKLSLHTVCEEANCPNLTECFSRKTATFMVLGCICTRNCTFCNVHKGKPGQVDSEEPYNVAQAVKALNLKHAVITSVTRDDLPDGGAKHFAEVIKRIKELEGSNTSVEVLIPDFKGDREALKMVVDARPEVINHNVETVPRLYSSVRPMAVYERSLELLRNIKLFDGSIYSKSGMMIGLGEKEEEVVGVLKDLRKAECDFLTIGQYLSPSKAHHPVVEYKHPDVFDRYKRIGMELGFKHVESAPLVRSSYHAEAAIRNKQ